MYQRDNSIAIDGPIAESPDYTFTFGLAIELLKKGGCVSRRGWNGKGMWLSISNPKSVLLDAEKFWSPHNKAHAVQQGGAAIVNPCITMKCADGSIQMGWVASQQDMLAEDWVLLDPDGNPTNYLEAELDRYGRLK